MPKLRTILIIGCLFAFIGSLTLNYVLYGYTQKYYRELNETRLHPLGISYYTVEQNQPEKPTLVIFGDSRAHAWQLSDETTHLQVINRAIGAQTSQQVLGRFDAHVAPLEPDIVLIEVGVNDFKAIPLFPHRRDEIVETAKKNITELVEKSQQLGAHVIISTIFPLGELPIERRIVWSPEVAIAIDAINPFIAGLGSDNVSVLLADEILRGEGDTIKPELSYDFLHINNQGYAALNAELEPLIHSILAKAGK